MLKNFTKKQEYRILLILNIVSTLGYLISWAMLDRFLGRSSSTLFGLLILLPCLLLLCAFPIYIIFYGIFAYRKTKQVILPNLMFAISAILWCFIYGIIDAWVESDSLREFLAHSSLTYMIREPETYLYIAILVSVSTSISIITMLITKSKQKRLNQATQSTSPTQPPEDQ